MNEENQPITKKLLTETLGEFTETVLLPAMSSMMDEKLKNYPTKDELKDELDKKVSNLVTKDYLDEKLSDLTGDLSTLMRKEDRKLGAPIELLKTKQVISDDDAKQILSLEPFPRT